MFCYIEDIMSQNQRAYSVEGTKTQGSNLWLETHEI